MNCTCPSKKDNKCAPPSSLPTGPSVKNKAAEGSKTAVISHFYALAKLLSHGSKAVRLAAESALAQAKETKRRPDPEGLKSLLRRNWTVDRAAKHWENRLMLLNQLGGLSTMNVDAMENRDLLHPKWAAEVTAFMQPQQIDNLSAHLDGSLQQLAKEAASPASQTCLDP